MYVVTIVVGARCHSDQHYGLYIRFPSRKKKKKAYNGAASQTLVPYPELGEADSGGLGACPQEKGWTNVLEKPRSSTRECC
jgi:hypothetical protein